MKKKNLSEHPTKIQNREKHKQTRSTTSSKTRVFKSKFVEAEIYYEKEISDNNKSLWENIIFYGVTFANASIGFAILAVTESLRKLAEFEDEIIE